MAEVNNGIALREVAVEATPAAQASSISGAGQPATAPQPPSNRDMETKATATESATGSRKRRRQRRIRTQQQQQKHPLPALQGAVEETTAHAFATQLQNWRASTEQQLQDVRKTAATMRGTCCNSRSRHKKRYYETMVSTLEQRRHLLDERMKTLKTSPLAIPEVHPSHRDLLRYDSDVEEEQAEGKRKGKGPRGYPCCPSLPSEPCILSSAFALNVVLIILKVIATVLSGSLAVLASAADSVLDILSSGIICCTSRASRKYSKDKYPIGRSRLMPVGILVFATAMCVTALQVITESIKILASGDSGAEISWFPLGVLMATVVSKLAMLLLARPLRHQPDIEAINQDSLNDVVTNTVSVIALALTWKFEEVWWLDAACAIGLFTLVMVGWINTARDKMKTLSGKIAPEAVFHKLIVLAMVHSLEIAYVDTVRVYHMGECYFAEVDIVMDPHISLHKAHDIGEALQFRIEREPEIERAFVHLDYESTHLPEH